MSTTTTTHRHALSIGTSGERSRTRTGHPTPRRRRPQHAAETVVSPMGPANRAPGVPLMGLSLSGYPSVMGGADAFRGPSVMGAGDRGVRTDLFGDSDPGSSTRYSAAEKQQLSNRRSPKGA